MIYWYKQPLGNNRAGGIDTIVFSYYGTVGSNRVQGKFYAQSNTNDQSRAYASVQDPGGTVTFQGADRTNGIWRMCAVLSDGISAPRLLTFDEDGVKLDDLTGGSTPTPVDFTEIEVWNLQAASYLDLKIAHMSLHGSLLSEANLSDIAANRNVLPDYSSDLIAYYPATTDWGTTAGVMEDAGPNGYDLTAPVGWTWSIDTPGGAYAITGTAAKYNGHDFDITPIVDGTMYSVRQTANSAAPTDQQIKDGIVGGNILESTSLAFTAGVPATITDYTGGSTNSNYDYYFYYEFSGGNEREDNAYQLLTTGLATATLSDVDGNLRPNLADVKYAWFDETTGDTLTAPITTGTTATDGSGDIFISLPGSTLNAGQTGRLDIDAVEGPDTYTASYFITVS
jgi:hypothetical protein